MGNKNKEFLSFTQAIKEILDDFRFYSDQSELFGEVTLSLSGEKLYWEKRDDHRWK